MLNYIITFFVLAVLAAILGFSGLASDFSSIARFLTMIFVILFVAGLVYSFITGRTPKSPL